MPPKQRFDREQILIAAMRIAEAETVANITVRKVGESLGGSSQPIYSYFQTIEKLTQEVRKEIYERVLEYTKVEYTNSPFLNIGVGFVVFARENPNLFRSLFLDANAAKTFTQKLIIFAEHRVSDEPLFQSINKSELRQLALSRWVYVYGFASLVNVGIVKNPTDDEIIKNIRTTGLPMIRRAYIQSKKKNRS
ncbi:TetR/AcrR family transcriptional regulator [Leptospira sp. WS92.C1]